jgi:hypothetical protein
VDVAILCAPQDGLCFALLFGFGRLLIVCYGVADVFCATCCMENLDCACGGMLGLLLYPQEITQLTYPWTKSVVLFFV